MTDRSRCGPIVVLTLLLGVGLVRWATSRVQFDDAFISMVYARNLAEGHGLVFNLGERVEGFTNLLWVLLLAAGARLGVAPHLAAPPLGVAAMLALVGLAWYSVLRMPGIPDHRRLLAVVGLAPLVLCHGFVASAGSGMETHFFALLVTLSILVFTVFRPAGPGAWMAAGLLPALLLLTRPDGVIPAGVAVLCAGTAVDGEARRPADRGLRLLCAGAIPTLAGLAVLGFKMRYYGELLPNPYFAKGADGMQLEAGVFYLGGFLASYPFVVLALVVVGWTAGRRRREPLGRLAVAAGAVFALYWLLLLGFGGDFMEYRLAFHVLPILILATAAGVAGGLRAWWAGAMVAVLAALSLAPPVLATRHSMQSLEEMDGYRRGGERVGRALAGLPDGARVATTLIGTIGYYSRQPVIDRWGLIDPEVRNRRATEDFNRGHLRFTHFSEATELGADLYVGHPEPKPCHQVRVDGPFAVVLSTGAGECVWMAVTSRDDQLKAFVCQRPDLFPRVGGGLCRDHLR
jgi:hypothetical protein